MDKYYDIIRNTEPDFNYTGTQGFISLIEETNENINKINVFMEEDFFTRFKKTWEKMENIRKEKEHANGDYEAQGKGTLDDPEIEGIGKYKDELDYGYDQIDTTDKTTDLIKTSTSKLKGLFLDLFAKLKSLYIQALRKIGEFLASKGLQNQNRSIKYKWGKVNFGLLKNFINEFGNPSKQNMLSQELISFNYTGGPHSRVSNNGLDIDIERRRNSYYYEKDANYLTVSKYLMIMSADKPYIFDGKDSTNVSELLKEKFVEKQETINIGKSELQKMYTNGVMDCMNKLFDRIMKNQANLIKEVDDETKMLKDMLKNDKSMETHRLSKDQINTKISRMNRGIGICIHGNAKFVNYIFNLIIYGMHQQIKATVAAIKEIKLNKDPHKKALVIV